MYIINIEALSCNHCTSITQLYCVIVALGIQHAMRVRHIVIRGLSKSVLFFHIFS